MSLAIKPSRKRIFFPLPPKDSVCSAVIVEGRSTWTLIKLKQKGVCKMKKPLHTHGSKIRKRPPNVFSELDAYLNAYLALLKKVSRPVNK